MCKTKEPRPPLWKVWVVAARPHTLTASISPILVGHFYTKFVSPTHNSWFSFLWLLFCVSIQLATNLHNDYADFVKGADTDKRVGQARATQKGWLSPLATACGATVCLFIALCVGSTLLHCTETLDSVVCWCILLSSMFNVVAYTGGPYPLGYIGLQDVSIAYWGLGDLFVFLYFGLVATAMIPFLSLPVDYRFDALLLACPVGWMSTCIIVVNNMRDRHTDVEANKRTTAVRFGANFCRVFYLVQMILSYSMVMVFAVRLRRDDTLAWEMFLPLLSVPLVIPCIKAVFTLEGQALNRFVGGTARVEFAYCTLLSIALCWTTVPHSKLAEAEL